MEILLDFIEIRLIPNQPVSLRRAKGAQIICASGTVWLTVAGIQADIVLHPGEAFVLRDRKLVVLEATQPDATTDGTDHAIVRVRTGAGRLRTWAKPRLQIA